MENLNIKKKELERLIDIAIHDAWMHLDKMPNIQVRLLKDILKLMNDIAPQIKTKVVHSQSKTAWNVISTTVGDKYKISRIPYFIVDDEIRDTISKTEALRHAQFISESFNKSFKKIE